MDVWCIDRCRYTTYTVHTNVILWICFVNIVSIKIFDEMVSYPFYYTLSGGAVYFYEVREKGQLVKS